MNLVDILIASLISLSIFFVVIHYSVSLATVR